MKKTKKIVALFFAVVMIMGMSLSALAEGNYSISIKRAPNSTSAHTYDAYQILTGKLYDGKLSDITWGTGVTGSITYDNVTYDVSVPEDAAKLGDALNGIKDAEPFAQAVEASKALGTVVAGSAVLEVGEDIVSIDGLDDGFYIIKDRDGSLANEEGESYSRYMVQVAGRDSGVQAKADAPSADKKVFDNEGANIEEGSDTADYAIGDNVPFELTSTIVTNIDHYVGAYKYVFHDTLSPGLTFNDDVKVYIASAEIGADKYSVNKNCADGCSFEVVIPNLKGIASVGDEVKVTYTAELNEGAVAGKDGNNNKMYLEFSNNPNADGTGKTPDKVVVVFTYGVVVNKYANEISDATRLAGAEFVLEKKVDGAYVAIDKLVVTTEEEGTLFRFKGLDVGEYQLCETATPDGFNSLSGPIQFAVTASHGAGDEGVLTVTGLSATDVTPNFQFEADANNAYLTTDVINKSGSVLPSTGGMGTTILYIIGAILVCGAGAILFVRKKMSNY